MRTSVVLTRVTRHHISENGIPQSHRHENLRSDFPEHSLLISYQHHSPKSRYVWRTSPTTVLWCLTNITDHSLMMSDQHHRPQSYDVWRTSQTAVSWCLTTITEQRFSDNLRNQEVCFAVHVGATYWAMPKCDIPCIRPIPVSCCNTSLFVLHSEGTGGLSCTESVYQSVGEMQLNLAWFSSVYKLFRIS
jgi:hypothetical protein